MTKYVKVAEVYQAVKEPDGCGCVLFIMVAALVGGCIAAAMLVRPGQTDDEKKGAAFIGFIVGVVIYMLITAIIIIFIVVTVFFAICKFGPTLANWAINLRVDIDRLRQHPGMPATWQTSGAAGIGSSGSMPGLPAPTRQAVGEVVSYMREQVQGIDREITLLQHSDDHDPREIQQEIASLLSQKQELVERLFRIQQS